MDKNFAFILQSGELQSSDFLKERKKERTGFKQIS